MKNYLKLTLLALLISTTCAFAKDEMEWRITESPFAFLAVNISHITTSQDGRVIFVVTKSESEKMGVQCGLFKSTDGGITWFYLFKK
jgi:hypothetical protein